MTSTVTDFSNLIDASYPIPGVDNDTQGFRDNFSSIKNALARTSDEISTLQLNSLDLTQTSTDFGFNIIKDAVAQGGGIVAIDNTVAPLTTNTTISYSLGSYQKIAVESSVNLNITNWPAAGINGCIVLEIYNSNSTTSKVVSFSGNIKNDNRSPLPLLISTASYNDPVIINLWSSDNGATVFLTKLLDTANTSTSTTSIISLATNAGVLESNSNLIFSNINGLTVATNAIATATIIGDQLPGNGTLIFSIDTTDDIKIGSTFKFNPEENITHVVKNVVPVNSISTTRKSITIDSYNEALYDSPSDVTNQTVTFNQGQLLNSVYYASDAPATAVGRPGDKKGAIFATTNTVYFCYSDYVNATTNIWSRISTTSW